MNDPLVRFKTNLLTIADHYALLAQRDEQRDERIKPGHIRWHGQYGKPDGTLVIADPVANALPTGPVKQAGNAPMVSGSHTAPVPVNIDLIDLTAPARHGSLAPIASPWPQDQTGHLPIATELDFWVRYIADQCGERLPVPTVPVLAVWLHDWSGWAWDHYPALDEMVVTVDRIARTLWAMTNPDRAPRPEHRTADCPACGEATLLGDGERVWCTVEDCGRVLTEDEYRTWAAAEAHRELNGPEGISAKAIALRWDRPIGTVHSWASRYGWTKTSGEQRPVLYLTEQVERTVASILKREAEEAARQRERSCAEQGASVMI